MGGGDGRRIDAFVSYSRAADSRLAPSIQRGLARLAKKWYRTRALNVFRDQTDLSASHALGASIERALADARFFVLLASPAAAESKWVAKEIEFWQRNRTSDTFLVALTDGTIRWDDEAGDFDWSVTDALPRSLSGYFEAEPLWQDLTWSRDADRLSLWHAGFRDAVATLAAPIHGSSKRALDNAEVKEHRALLLVGALATALILTLAVSFGIQYWFATAERDRANANARDATVMSAIQRAQVELADAETGYDVSAYRRLMAARSLAGRPSVEGAAYDAALDAAYSRPNLLRVTEVDSGPDSRAAMTVDGGRVAFGGRSSRRSGVPAPAVLPGPPWKQRKPRTPRRSPSRSRATGNVLPRPTKRPSCSGTWRPGRRSTNSPRTAAPPLPWRSAPTGRPSPWPGRPADLGRRQRKAHRRAPGRDGRPGRLQSRRPKARLRRAQRRGLRGPCPRRRRGGCR